MKSSDFVHLHVHSEFSLQDSLLPTKTVVELAKQHDMWAVGLTDLHNLFGVVKFYQQVCQQGIKPIIGCELRIEDDLAVPEDQMVSGLGSPVRYRLLLLCQNALGYRQLCDFLTRS